MWVIQLCKGGKDTVAPKWVLTNTPIYRVDDIIG